jgi:hypothetical protein
MSPSLIPRCTAPALILLCLTACASPGRIAPDSVNGNSVRATLASQVLRPEAVRNVNPVDGIDGTAALQAQQKYEKSFSKPATDPATTLVQHR